MGSVDPSPVLLWVTVGGYYWVASVDDERENITLGDEGVVEMMSCLSLEPK